MKEIASLIGHEKAITQILVDAAGRYIFTGSAAEKKIKIWDGLTFTLEKQFDDVNIGSMVLGENCLMVSSFRPPFLRLWRDKGSHRIDLSNRERDNKMSISKESEGNAIVAAGVAARSAASHSPTLEASDMQGQLQQLNKTITEVDVVINIVSAIRNPSWLYAKLRGDR